MGSLGVGVQSDEKKERPHCRDCGSQTFLLAGNICRNCYKFYETEEE